MKKSIFSIKKIRTKLIIIFLLIGLVPLGTASAIIYSLNSKELIKKEEVGLRDLAKSTSNSIEQWLDKRMSEIQLASKTDTMSSLNPKRQLSFIKKIKDQSEAYETVVFTDKEGIVRAHTTEENIGVMNLADREYFKQGLKGESNISNVLTSKATGNRILVLATPVKDEKGEILGVLSASVNFELVIQEFVGSNIEKSIIPNLVDNEGILQVHPTKDWVGKAVEETSISQDVQQLIKKGKTESGYSIVEDEGKEYVIAYTPIEISGYVLYFKTPIELVLSATNHIKNMTFLIFGISFILIVLLAIFVSNSISKPLTNVTRHIKKIAEGDLTGENIEVRTKDEIGILTSSINTMSGNLKELIQEVNQSSELVAAHSEELTASAEESKTTTEYITTAIQEVASGADSQSEKVSHSEKALETMAMGISQIAISSSSISETSQSTIDKAQTGGESVKQTVEQMKSIQSSVQTSNEMIKSLDERSKQIGNIVEVITGIADQTNLLALNAAIEAARAGEQGKGFAVVADEVRKLAEESKKSSDQIRQLISSIQYEMISSLKGMGQVTQDVNDGLELANRTQGNFFEIIESTKLVSEQIDQMAATAQEISVVTAEAAVSFGEISNITKETTASTQEVASSSEEQLGSMEEIATSAQSLSEMAVNLREMISKFKV
ncbi:methyl-accepting chemotaxis protein [Metabacillus endolithicus]|uniref:Methyl-accepting chemotaxis protein n=1 Tax=Metabacillus endolithicus TaxID=1535204 RepID=A0ABW5BXI0_9BACI|nr:methyl-accepting chemotaxis protein [Metabacillus endolithicus]UPG64018.1 methyl-accepting chemotaxis protein [Metabacillus endolithicus]